MIGRCAWAALQELLTEAQPPPPPAASGGGGGNPLADPEAAAALFKDPVRLQKLLQDNPALISVLKSRLGM